MALVAGFWTLIHSVQDHLDAYPALVVAYPLLGMGSLLLLVPLIVFLSFHREFEGLSPLYPPHFLFLLRRIAGASQQNNMKVMAVPVLPRRWQQSLSVGRGDLLAARCRPPRHAAHRPCPPQVSAKEL